MNSTSFRVNDRENTLLTIALSKYRVELVRETATLNECLEVAHLDHLLEKLNNNRNKLETSPRPRIRTTPLDPGHGSCSA